jgi:tetratricopeptide (TPR) repeat protein
MIKKAEKHVAEKIYDWAADTFERAGEHERAKEYWLKAAEELYPKEHFPKAADCYKKAGRIDKARECYRLIAESEASAGNYNNAGLWYAKQGDISKAKEYWMKEAETRKAKRNNVPIEAAFEDILYENITSLARSKDSDVALEVLASEEDIKGEDAKYRVMEICVWTSNYDVGVETLLDIGLTDPELCIMFAHDCNANDHSVAAAEFYQKGGETEKARELWIKKGDEMCDRLNFEKSADWYIKAGMTEQEADMRVAEQLGTNGAYVLSIAHYEKAGLAEQQSVLKVAEHCVHNKDYGNAASFYSILNVSLSDIPQEARENMLKLVTEGNVKAIQEVARMVKTEEEEIMYNEARAGMVL